ncbi:MAG: DUF2442 domain-containing protein [Deltaproteobacteria bacterium]|nr:DUF2442 domain-containing protein [Deltaproteobacteria bacterium]
MANHLKKSTHLTESFHHMIIHIIHVKYCGEFCLHLKFNDGFEKDIDMWPLIKNQGGLLESLKDKVFFSKVTLDTESGTIMWPNGVDYAPDVLYQL